MGTKALQRVPEAALEMVEERGLGAGLLSKGAGSSRMLQSPVSFR